MKTKQFLASYLGVALRTLVLTFLLPANAQTIISVSASFQNRIYVASPGNGSLQGAAASFFGGNVNLADISKAPNNGTFFLAQSAFGQPVASSGNPDPFICDEIAEYHLWLQNHFLPSDYLDFSKSQTIWGVEADPDGDGIPNFTEFAMGLDPNNYDTNAVTTSPILSFGVENLNGINRVVIRHRRRTDAPYLHYELFATSRLTNWISSEVSFDLPVSVQLHDTIPLGGNAEQLTYVDMDPLYAATNRFYQLRITYTGRNVPSQVTLSAPSTNDVFGGTLVVSNTVTVTAQAVSSSGCVIQIEYFANGVLIGRASGGSSSITWTPTSTNVYQLVARATDGLGASKTSAITKVTVDRDDDGDGIPNSRDKFPSQANHPPVINSLQVTSQANFHDIGQIVASLTGSDPEGEQFFYQVSVDGAAVGPRQESGQVVLQPGAVVFGFHTLKAFAIDKWGAMTTNQTRQMFVFRTPPLP